MKTLAFDQPNFWADLKAAQALDIEDSSSIESAVSNIVNDVKNNGDSAVIECSNKFDGTAFSQAEEFETSKASLQSAFDSQPESIQVALKHAAERVEKYAQHQKMSDWSFEEADGSVYGQRVTPLDRVGIYVPGGKAAYPSSVIMNAVPAKVAGVSEIIMVSPTPNGQVNDVVLAAAYVAGVDRVFCIGGAQAVSALAFGTETVPAVDKIVGPGNIFVATAKRQVFGQVGIDMIAGPSEVLIISDGNADPDWVAMDMFAQAEHDEIAQAILISFSDEHINAVKASVDALLPTMERKEIIEKSLANRALFIKVDSLEQCAAVANEIAAEHLELAMDDPESILPAIKHAGAIFVGHYAAEALGDYCAGPNHVLPTARTARFASPLGVYDFQKRTSILRTSKAGAKELSKTASTLARGEGLTAHARSAELRG